MDENGRQLVRRGLVVLPNVLKLLLELHSPLALDAQLLRDQLLLILQRCDQRVV